MNGQNFVKLASPVQFRPFILPISIKYHEKRMPR
jgi:hypothetical protein